MTNEMLLRKEISKSGYKIRYIAESINLTYQGFLNKVTGKTEFNAKEIAGLCKILNIDDAKRNAIFFCE